MCGRTVFTLSRKRVIRVANIKAADSVLYDIETCKSFNLAPTKSLVCVTEDEVKHERHVHIMKWGIDPRFETEKHLNTINARVEGVSKSRMYAHLVDSHRCVILVDAFYEWAQTGKVHTPYLIRFKDEMLEASIPLGTFEVGYEDTSYDDGEKDSVLPTGVSPLFLAGIFEKSRISGEDKCSILTMDSSGCVSKIHSRMPVILSPESAKLWLSGTPFSDVHEKISQTARTLSRDLVCIEVSTLVNNIANQSRDVTLPAAESKKRSFEKGLGRFFSKREKISSDLK